MKILLSHRATRDYAGLSQRLQKTAEKQFLLLLRSLGHPSLRAKKYDIARDIWQARVNRDYRFYFQITGHVYRIIAIVRHPK